MSAAVRSSNPFALLGEDGDNSPPTSAKSTPAAKPAAAAAPVVAAKEVPGSKPTAGARSRGAYPARGGARNVIKTESSPAEDPESGFEGERRAPKGDRGSFAPRGGDRGRGGARGRGSASRGRGGGEGGGYRGGAAGGGERRNDGRRSGHALPDSEKKIASGWGADEGNAELAAEVEGAKDADAEAAAPSTPAPEAEEPVAAPEDPEVAAAREAARKAQEEEDNAKTYDEYLAERATAALGSTIGKMVGRTVEGVTGLVGEALKKVEEAEWYSGAGKKETKTSDKPKAAKKEKTFLEINAKFAPIAGSDRGGARGGRGGARGGAAPRGGSDRPARGGAARGGARGGARTQVVQANDEKAFPALGA